jgi:hypothetical protein
MLILLVLYGYQTKMLGADMPQVMSAKYYGEPLPKLASMLGK